MAKESEGGSCFPDLDNFPQVSTPERSRRCYTNSSRTRRSGSLTHSTVCAFSAGPLRGWDGFPRIDSPHAERAPAVRLSAYEIVHQWSSDRLAERCRHPHKLHQQRHTAEGLIDKE